MPSRITLSTIAIAIVTALCLVLSTSLATAGEKPAISDSYKKSLSALLDVLGAKVSGEQVAFAVAQETLAGIAATGTPVTEQVQQIVFDEAMSEFSERFGDIQFLTDLYAPFYAEHLTEQDLNDFLAFYTSDIGKKMLEKMPVIGQSGAMALQQASYDKIPDFQQKVDEKLRAVGIVITPMTQPMP